MPTQGDRTGSHIDLSPPPDRQDSATNTNVSTLRVSIALCTCNGASYLLEQLQSFMAQTKMPHELVVCDDASEDGTVEILETFASTAGFPVRLYRNAERLGPALNFDRAITLCEGDVIALSDQDDVWHAQKLERMCAKLESARAQAVFSDADVTDLRLAPLGYSMWQRLHLTAKEMACFKSGNALDVLLRRQVVMGAALAFRSELRNLVTPIPAGWYHDAWIALIAAASGSLVQEETALVKYRQHQDNQIGGRKVPLLAQIRKGLEVDRQTYYQREILQWAALKERLQNKTEVSPAKLSMIEAKLQHLRRRAQFPESRWKRFPTILHELAAGGYARYSRNWGSVALDLLMR